jgi:hypothetical protein
MTRLTLVDPMRSCRESSRPGARHCRTAFDMIASSSSSVKRERPLHRAEGGRCQQAQVGHAHRTVRSATRVALITRHTTIRGFRRTITRCVDRGALTSKGAFPGVDVARGTPTIGQLVVCHPPYAWSSESPNSSSITRGVRSSLPASTGIALGTAARLRLFMGDGLDGRTGDRAVAEQALRRPRAVHDPLTPSVAADSPGERAATMIRRPATSRRTVQAPYIQPPRPPSRDRRLAAPANIRSRQVRPSTGT